VVEGGTWAEGKSVSFSGYGTDLGNLVLNLAVAVQKTQGNTGKKKKSVVAWLGPSW